MEYALKHAPGIFSLLYFELIFFLDHEKFAEHVCHTWHRGGAPKSIFNLLNLIFFIDGELHQVIKCQMISLLKIYYACQVDILFIEPFFLYNFSFIESFLKLGTPDSVAKYLTSPNSIVKFDKGFSYPPLEDHYKVSSFFYHFY